MNLFIYNTMLIPHNIIKFGLAECTSEFKMHRLEIPSLKAILNLLGSPVVASVFTNIVYGRVDFEFYVR